jgi:hypothetical protein
MPITIRLPHDLEQRLRIRAKAQGVRLSKFVCKAIAEKLERDATGHPTAYDLGKSVFGKYGSGRDDLSSRRKAILTEVLHARRGR